MAVTGSNDAAAGTLVAEAVALPGGAAGIGFDDLRFSPELGRVLVPAGRSGNLDLVDPVTGRVEAIAGFSSRALFAGGHGEGTTSADAGRGLVFAVDRTARNLVIIDAATHVMVAQTRLASSPDYVRWVEPRGEVWVTQPDQERIEVFEMPAGSAPTLLHSAFIPVPGGPESLVVDAARGYAFTHLWSGATVAVDLAKRAVVERWPNGCRGSRGIALDSARGFLFVGCTEGKAVVLDVTRRGAVRGSLRVGAGVDVIDYSPSLAHLYLPGSDSGTMAIVGVSRGGVLSLLGTVKTAPSAHCVAADARGQAWVCDPEHGRLLRVRDPYPQVE